MGPRQPQSLGVWEAAREGEGAPRPGLMMLGSLPVTLLTPLLLTLGPRKGPGPETALLWPPLVPLTVRSLYPWLPQKLSLMPIDCLGAPLGLCSAQHPGPG